MKIFIATGIFPPDVGGPATYVEKISSELIMRGHQARVLTYSDNLAGETIKDNYRVFLVKRGSKLRSYFKYFLKVLKYAKDADIIYLQDSVSAGFPTTVANLFLKKRLVLKIVGDYAWEMGGNKIAPTVDEFYPFDFEKYSFKINLLKAVQTWVAEKTDKIITPSNYLKKIVSKGWGIEEDKVNVVYNSAVIPAFEGIVGAGVNKNKNLILSIGRLVPWKGFDTLIELMPNLLKENPDFKLVIIGDGPERENLVNLSKKLGLTEKVFFDGRLSHQEALIGLKTAGVFVLNTRYEGLSHVLIEALACETPVITTNVGGNPEVIKNYENGYLVDYNDKLELESSILKIYNDKEIRQEFIKNGLKSLDKFNFEKMIDDTVEVLSFRNDKSNVLMISADKTILDSQSVSAGRMCDYGKLCDELHIIVFNSDDVLEKTKLSENVWIYPTNSFIKASAILDAKSIGKRIINEHKISVITTQNPFETGLVGYRLARNFKIGLNVQLHGDFFGSRYWREESLLNEIRDKLGRYIIKRAHSVRVVSHRIKKSLIEKLKTEEGKIIVAPIFTDTEKISQEAPKFSLYQKYLGKNPILLAVGRLEKEKNYPLLFRAFKNILGKFPDALLVIVGDGSLRKSLESDIKTMGLFDNVVFEGWQKDLASYYKTADLYLLTSFYEGWGRTVVEATACGCPVVMTDVGVAGEVIKHNESGFVVEVDNEIELTEKILKSLGQEKSYNKETIRALLGKEETLQLIKKSWQLAKNNNCVNLDSSFIMENITQKSKTFLITGGAGFIGSHLTDRLLSDGHSVICLDNFFTGREENVRHHFENPNFKLVKHDITAPFNHPGIDGIFHLASPASPIHYQIDPVQTTKTNVLGAINVLELAKTLGARVLIASTSEVYGDPLEHPQKETYFGNVDTLSPRACYDEGKRCAETLCMDYLRQHNSDIKIVRIFNTYGPRMTFEDGRVVSNFILQALKNEDITIYGDGKQTRSFQYADDLVNGFIKMMWTENFRGPVNIGNPNEFTMIELAKKILELTNSKSQLVFKNLPEGDPKVRQPDISLAKEKLNWEPKINLEEGLKLTIEDFRKRLGI